MTVDATHDVPPTFAGLGLPAALVKALAHAKLSTPTPVQAVVIPDALAGRDVLGRAETGSGKTLAFGLPIMARLAGSPSIPRSPRALVVVPTRELAGQVRGALEPMADASGLRIATVYGGSPYDRQIKRLRAGVDVVVATPGRLQDLIRRGACRLDRVAITVLDEADHLCDLGFFPAVTELVAMTPPGGQRLLLSATLDGDVDRLVRTHLSSPVTHDCDPGSDIPQMAHHVLVTAAHDKLESTAALLRANPRSIVFTRTRHGATALARELAALGVSTVDLHGSLTQNARERNLRKFRSGLADVVVATDVAARGIHVDGVSLVVHYDAPTERKAYLHRSGRTGRAGSSGTVVTLTTARHVGSVTRLQRAVGVSALHHDARTAARPMTAESLARFGVASDATQAHDAPRSRRDPPRGSAFVAGNGGGGARRSRVTRSQSGTGRGAGPGSSDRVAEGTARSADKRAGRQTSSSRGRHLRRDARPAGVHSSGAVSADPGESSRRSRAETEEQSNRSGRPSRGRPSNGTHAPRSTSGASRPTSNPSPRPKRGATGGAPKAARGPRTKKPRWTAAERRAGSRH